MATEKKRLNKKAKAVAKLLNDSELLVANKTANKSKTDHDFKPNAMQPKTSAPHKTRPDKKRG